jgi:hypothetical protein
MEETRGSATLVEAPPEADGVTTTLPRAEVEEVLKAEDGPIELYLDLLRPADDTARTVRVAWDHDDLERILEASSGETVTLAFNRRELEEAFEEADVEGHGLRERALVLTVAVTTAAAGASIASAAPEGGPIAAAGGSAPAQVTGGAGESSASDEVAGYQRAMPSDYAAGSHDMTGYQRAMPSDYGPTTGPVAAAGDQSPAETTGGAGDVIGGAVGAAGGESPAAVTGGAGPQQPEFIPGVTDFPSTGVQQQPAGEGGGISIPDPARDAAIAGGLALIITAAAFALKGQRRRIERPA